MFTLFWGKRNQRTKLKEGTPSGPNIIRFCMSVTCVYLSRICELLCVKGAVPIEYVFSAASDELGQRDVSEPMCNMNLNGTR